MRKGECRIESKNEKRKKEGKTDGRKEIKG